MLQVLYKDEHMVAVVKPAGVLSEDKEEGSMPALLREQLGAEYVGCVHRLDRAVGGVMIYALDQPTCGKLSAMVAAHQMVKEYLAVVHGCPEPAEGEMRDLLFKDSARNKSFVVKRMRKGVREACCIINYWKRMNGTESPFHLCKSGWKPAAVIRFGYSFHPVRCHWLATAVTAAVRTRTA